MRYEIKNIYKSFNNKIVLNNISYKFPNSGLVWIKGNTGSGKTTLLNIISGLTCKDSGEIFGFKGKKISYVFQDDRLIPWLTAKENLKIIKNTDDKIVENFLNLVGLENDYNTKTGDMSGGMKKKLGIARALAFNGDVFLMDEPFTGLDENSEVKILNVLKDYYSKKLVILVSHNNLILKILSNNDLNYNILKI